MKENIEFDLKLSQASRDQIYRGDLIFKNGSVWCCASKAANLFINLDDRQQQ